MRNLELKSYQVPEILDLLLVQQSHITNDPWLPRLKGFRWDRVTEELIPLIPFFLSPRTTKINITMLFGKYVPAALIVPIITRLPTLCPDMDDICLGPLPNDPVITEVVSEMLLACKKDQLRTFRVDSPLTKEALEVACQLPKLSHLKVVVEGSAPLPRLPNLATISIAFDSCLDWLEGFRGARLARLESVDFFSASGVVDDFFGVFERATLTTVKHSLSKLSFCTVHRWKPNYRPLVPFTQLEELSVEFSCVGICSSGIDDDVIVELAEAMPKLKVLILGDPPCDVITGVTIKGLTALAHNCQHLSRLRIHFRVDSVVEAVEIQRQSRSLRETTAWKHDCALTDLEVGGTPTFGLGGWRIAKGLLQIFPCLRKIGIIGIPPWREVQHVLLSAETIESNHQAGETWLQCC